MEKALRKHVFHEAEVGGVAFRATFHQGRATLHVEDADGHEAQICLMGSGMPSLFYAEAWTMRRRAFGPGWALCHANMREPLMHLGNLSDGEVQQLIREFGLHVDFSDEVVTFPESAAARSLKRIVVENPHRAAIFRKNAGGQDSWLRNVAPQGSLPPSSANP